MTCCGIPARSNPRRYEPVTETRARERERAAAGWFGAPQEGQVPVRAATGGSATAGREDDLPAGSRWLRRIGRVLRDAIIGVAILAMVPIGLVSLSNGAIWGNNAYLSNTRIRLRQFNPVRPFAVAKDARVSAAEAGHALAALQPEPAPDYSNSFVLRPVGDRATMPWKDVTLAPDMFPAARANSWNGPNSSNVLETVANGVSPAELAFLKTVATAPLWQQFDLVARAPAVDILGGRFVLPFPENALASQLPLMRYAATKELAYAGVSRAAYHLAVGERPEAEAVLKSVIGFGFAIADNGTYAIEGLIGNVIVGIGRDALERYYTLTGDPRATVLVGLRPGSVVLPRSLGASNRPTVDFLRERLIQTAENPAEPRPVRFEALKNLSVSSCTNVRELVFGPRPEVSEAYERARRDLARFPSERALVDLVQQATSRNLDGLGVQNSDAVIRVLVGASTIAGVVLDNPRMSFCTRVLTGSTR